MRVLKIEGRARGAEYVKRVVECYDRALRAMEDGDYTPELAAALKEREATVFNRGLWEGYYAGRPIVEHSRHHGSAATKRKVYVGKVTNFFKKISVAEVLVEAAPLHEGDELLWMGETTGVVEQHGDEIFVDEHPVQTVLQGTTCSVKTVQLIRRGDKLYKLDDTIGKETRHRTMKSGVSYLQIHILITPIFIGFRSGENFDSISCKKIRKARTHRIKE